MHQQYVLEIRDDHRMPIDWIHKNYIMQMVSEMKNCGFEELDYHNMIVDNIIE